AEVSLKADDRGEQTRRTRSMTARTSRGEARVVWSEAGKSGPCSVGQCHEAAGRRPYRNSGQSLCRRPAMRNISVSTCAAVSLFASSSVASAQTVSGPTIPVTVENYNRAQSDVYFAGLVKSGGFGTFQHGRELARPGQRGIPRPNRDTLYSLAVFDLDAG